MRARLRDTEIFFDIDGPGLVHESAGWSERGVGFLVHGGPGVDHTSLKGRYGVLKDSLQLVYFDHRGQGRSGRCDRAKYNLDENVADMDALRQHLGLGQIVSLGTSYGGIVAMAHAARYPEAVSDLILVATTAHHANVARAQQLVAERGTPEQIEQCSDLYAGRIDTPEKLQRYFEITGSLYSRKPDPALSRDGLSQAILTAEPLNEAHGPNGFLRRLDLRLELPNIAARTLIIAGRHDWICQPERSEEIHRLIPGSELHIFEDSSHSVASDEPDRFIATVRAFLSAGRSSICRGDSIDRRN